MRYRWLSVFPLLYAAGFIVIVLALQGGGHDIEPFRRSQLLLIRVFAIVGCVAAASAFGKGDHLRRAWLLLAWATILVLVRDLLIFPVTLVPAEGWGRWLTTGLAVLSNFALLGGTWMLARAWKRAAIELPGGRGGAITVTVVTAIIALVVVGPAALDYAKGMMAGDPGTIVGFVSAVVDMLAVCLIAPLLLTALALRGGVVGWPWALITASLVCWLLYDGAAEIQGLLPIGFPLKEVFRGMAENYLAVAGLAQLLVVKQVRKQAADATMIGMAPKGA